MDNQQLRLPQVRRQYSALGNRRVRLRRGTVIAALLGIMLLASVPLYGYVTLYVLPPRETVVRVNDVSYSRGDLVQILRMQAQDARRSGGTLSLGSAPLQTPQSLLDGELIRQGVSRYDITVSDADIDNEIRRRMLGGALDDESLTPEQLDSRFVELYRQFLGGYALKESLHRRLVSQDLSRTALIAHLAEQLPDAVPQAHLYKMVVADQRIAVDVVDRLGRGVPFSDLAGEFNTLPQTGRDGEMGWFPQPLLERPAADLAFNLPVGEASQPIAETDGTFSFYMVAERQEERPVTQAQLPQLRQHALQEWIRQEQVTQDIAYHMNSEVYTWLVQQIRVAAPPSQS